MTKNGESDKIYLGEWPGALLLCFMVWMWTKPYRPENLDHLLRWAITLLVSQILWQIARKLLNITLVLVLGVVLAFLLLLVVPHALVERKLVAKALFTLPDIVGGSLVILTVCRLSTVGTAKLRWLFSGLRLCGG